MHGAWATWGKRGGPADLVFSMQLYSRKKAKRLTLADLQAKALRAERIASELVVLRSALERRPT